MDADIDQSELARIVGCTPGAINQIVMGNVRRSKFLPDIAEALGVALRWLRGEDVPRDPSAPIQPRSPPPVQFVMMPVAWPSEPALEQMFEAFLEIAGDDLSRAELARELAQQLPIGLSALQGPLVTRRTVATTRPRALATDDRGPQR